MSVKPYSTIKSAEELTRTGYIYQALQYLDNLLKGLELPDCEGDQIKNIAAYNLRKSDLNTGNVIIEVDRLEQEGQILGTVPVYWRNNAGKIELTTDYDNGPWQEIGSANLQPWEDYAMDIASAEGAAAEGTVGYEFINMGNDFSAFAIISHHPANGAISILKHLNETNQIIFEFGMQSNCALYCKIGADTYTSNTAFMPDTGDPFYELGVVCDRTNNQLYFFVNGIVEPVQAVSAWNFPAATTETIRLGDGLTSAWTLACVGLYSGKLYAPGTQVPPFVRKPHEPFSFLYYNMREPDGLDATTLTNCSYDTIELTINASKATLTTVSV